MRRAMVVAVVIVLGGAPSAHAYRHHRGYSGGAARARSINAVRMQVAALEAIASQAEAVAAQNKVTVDAANSRISGDREAIASAHDQGRQASRDMEAAEKEMLDAAGADSDIVKSKEKYEYARSKLQSEEHRVLHSREYLAEVAKTEGEPEHADVVPKLRAKFLAEDEDYQHALTMWEIARKGYSGERTEALSRDEHWLAASEQKRQTLLAAAKALNDSKSGGLQKLPAAVNMHEAQRIAQQARAYAGVGRSILGAMGAGMPARRGPAPSSQPPAGSAAN